MGWREGRRKEGMAGYAYAYASAIGMIVKL